MSLPGRADLAVAIRVAKTELVATSVGAMSGKTQLVFMPHKFWDASFLLDYFLPGIMQITVIMLGIVPV